jgi:translocation and assembly module TamB
VKITGFAGALSSTATMDRLTIADREGIWLELEGATLNWRRAALLSGRIEVKELSAERLRVLRKPIPEPSLPSAEATSFAFPDLPVSVDVAKVLIADVGLAEPVVGAELSLSVSASALLEDGSGNAKILADRIDGQLGTFVFDGGYDGTTEALNIDFSFNEEAGGIVAQLMNLPGDPALEASVVGQGPISAFSADLLLASDGQERMQGTVSFGKEAFGDVPAEGEEPLFAQVFQANLAGDVTALFAPEYRDFFGSDLSLDLAGLREPSGALEISNFDISAQTVALNGRVRLSPEQWPVVMDVSGHIGAADGSRVLLPTSGEKTYIGALDLALAYDAKLGPDWQGSLRIQQGSQGDSAIERMNLTAAGVFSQSAGRVDGVTGDVTFDGIGLALPDPALAEAIGETLRGAASFAYAPNTPLKIERVLLGMDTAQLTGDFDIGGVAKGLPVNMKAKLQADDLASFSAISGQDLNGKASLAIEGSAEVLSGAFDLKVSGETNDLAVGIAQADALTGGKSQLVVDAVRDETGTEIRQFLIATPELTASAAGSVATGAFSLDYEANLRDFAVVAPQYPGFLAIQGGATQGEDGIEVQSALSGPLGVSAQVDGLATGPNARIKFGASLPDFSAVIPEFPGKANIDGEISKEGSGWRVLTKFLGDFGVSADIAGLINSSEDVDISVKGAAPLGLAAPFLAPNTVGGDGTFDLTLKGAPSLSAVSGMISVRDAAFSAPQMKTGLRDIRADVTLQNAQASLAAEGALTTSGTVSVAGDLSLLSGLAAQLNIDLNGAEFSDPALFKTTLDGAITVNGPLTGGAMIAGKIDVGQTNITVPAGNIAASAAIPDLVHIGASAAVLQTLSRAGLERAPVTESPSAAPEFGLDVLIDAPNQIFIRGRGIDAELEGEIQLTGTTQNMISSGGLELVRGRIKVLEKRFELTEGEILLEGSFDPRLSLIATTPIPEGTGSIVLEGVMSDPDIRFESNPAAPEDQVLALIFFGVKLEDLSPFQALQLASAVATLAGKGGNGAMSRLRNSLPLDDFEIDADEDGNAELRLGKRFTDDVYSDFTVNGKGDTEISLNIDLTPKIVAKGVTSNDGNSALGLYFETNY